MTVTGERWSGWRAPGRRDHEVLGSGGAAQVSHSPKVEKCPTRPDSRVCWSLSGSPETVLFHARYNHRFIPHSHDATTILIVTDGAVELGVGADRYHVGGGQMAVIGAHQIHSARPLRGSGWKMRSIHLPAARISDATSLPMSECSQMHFARPVQSGLHIGPMFLDLHHCTETMGACGNDLEGFIKDLYRQIDAFAPRASRETLLDDRVEIARQMIVETLPENIQINEIAGEVGMSVFSLIRKFEKAYGISPHAWRMQARANEAAKLLRAGHRAAHAAASCGFSDQSHMTRTFRKVFGITPRQYSGL